MACKVLRISVYVCLLVLLAAACAHGVELFSLKPPFANGYNASDPASPYFFFPVDPANGVFCNDGEVKVNKGFVQVTAEEFNFSIPLSSGGTLDHPKYLTLIKTPYGPSPTQKLVMEVNISGQTYKTEDHPFPKALVSNVEDDLRLASVGFVNVDFDNFMVLDFLMTNTAIYALHERLPFGVGPYKAFTQVKKVASCRPSATVLLQIIYDKTGGTISWLVNSQEVLKVTKIGFKSTDPDVVTIFENKNEEQSVSPNGFNSGFGYFTILDFTDPSNEASNTGLVKLVDLPDAYAKPTRWFDPTAKLKNRLWGQGAQVQIFSHTVSVVNRRRGP